MKVTTRLIKSGKSRTFGGSVSSPTHFIKGLRFVHPTHFFRFRGFQQFRQSFRFSDGFLPMNYFFLDPPWKALLAHCALLASVLCMLNYTVFKWLSPRKIGAAGRIGTTSKVDYTCQKLTLVAPCAFKLSRYDFYVKLLCYKNRLIGWNKWIEDSVNLQNTLRVWLNSAKWPFPFRLPFRSVPFFNEEQRSVHRSKFKDGTPFYCSFRFLPFNPWIAVPVLVPLKVLVPVPFTFL